MTQQEYIQEPPILCFHRHTGQFYVKRQGRRVYLGKDESQAAARLDMLDSTGINAKFIAEFANCWLSNNPQGLGFDDLYASFWSFKKYIARHGPWAGVNQWREMIDEANAHASQIDRHSRVYFIDDGSAIKIGHAVDVAQRMCSLQTGNRNVLRMLGNVPGGRYHEQELHHEFSSFRIMRGGEWFAKSRDVLRFVDNISDLAATAHG